VGKSPHTKKTNSGGPRVSFDDGQRLSQSSGSHPEDSREPTRPVDASVGLQGLQEPIVAASDVGHSLQEPIFTSSAISPPPEGARLQEPIVASSAILLLQKGCVLRS
jgi:hypothetical protein